MLLRCLAGEIVGFVGVVGGVGRRSDNSSRASDTFSQRNSVAERMPPKSPWRIASNSFESGFGGSLGPVDGADLRATLLMTCLRRFVGS